MGIAQHAKPGNCHVVMTVAIWRDGDVLILDVSPAIGGFGILLAQHRSLGVMDRNQSRTISAVPGIPLIRFDHLVLIPFRQIHNGLGIPIPHKSQEGNAELGRLCRLQQHIALYKMPLFAFRND